MAQRIAILGSGANGSAIGADLTNAGLDVKLIDQWPAHIETMRTNGLTVEMPEETVTTRVDAYHLCDIATFTEPLDVVLMLFKAYDSRWAAELIKPHLADDGVLIGVQNGMTAETIADVVGVERTLGCVIEVASEVYDPGHVVRNSPPDEGSWFALGALDPSAARHIEPVAEIMGHAGTVEISDDILSAKWMKLVSNTMTLATTALTGLALDEAERLPGMRELMLKAGAEALTAGAARGHPVTPIFGLTPAEMANTNQLLETVHDKLMSFTRPGTRTTVLADHIKGRQSEAGDVNGAVVETLGESGAPANAAILEVTRRIERGELAPAPENIDLVRELVAI
ncbi:MAG: 2-dehydropantoate 2-reductase N-terminal domain-containing protein [Rhodospirillaceae bacterium]